MTPRSGLAGLIGAVALAAIVGGMGEAPAEDFRLEGRGTPATSPLPASGVCAEGTYVTHPSASATSPGEPACATNVCGPGEAWSWFEFACVPYCALTCEAGRGMSGRLIPFLSALTDSCVCETEPGYYFDTAQEDVAPCDADGDGWVRNPARAFVEDADLTVRGQARCTVRTIDRVVLVNEYNQALTVPVTDPRLDLAITYAPLYETERNDRPDAFEGCPPGDPERCGPVYGEARFRAAQVNSFTKACTGARDDLNGNQVADVRESAGSDTANPVEPWLLPFLRLGYFTELHDAHYEPAGDGRHGAFVIRERSRCDATFPLGYAEATAGSVGGAPEPVSSYWQSCTRRRPPAYTATGDAEAVGFDFAAFSCAADDGACPVLSPPVAFDAAGHPHNPGQLTSSPSDTPEHGLCGQARPRQICDANGACTLVGDTAKVDHWRGMNHASQFRCAEVSAFGAVGRVTVDSARVWPWAVEAPLLYDVNTCAIDTSNPEAPTVVCDQPSDRAAAKQGVHWLARRFDAGPYEEGCVDEWYETDATNRLGFRVLCPGYEEHPRTVQGFGHPDAFGLLMCGCSLTSGGADCSVGCPFIDRQVGTAHVHYGGDCDEGSAVNGYCPISDAGGRRGYWLCGDTTASATVSETDVVVPSLVGSAGSNRYQITGAVPANQTAWSNAAPVVRRSP